MAPAIASCCWCWTTASRWWREWRSSVARSSFPAPGSPFWQPAGRRFGFAASGNWHWSRCRFPGMGRNRPPTTRRCGSSPRGRAMSTKRSRSTSRQRAMWGRSAASSTDCRWRSSWPPRGCGCFRRRRCNGACRKTAPSCATARAICPTGSGPWRPPLPGATTCWNPRTNAPSGGWQCFVAELPSTRRPR